MLISRRCAATSGVGTTVYRPCFAAAPTLAPAPAMVDAAAAAMAAKMVYCRRWHARQFSNPWSRATHTDERQARPNGKEMRHRDISDRFLGICDQPLVWVKTTRRKNIDSTAMLIALRLRGSNPLT